MICSTWSSNHQSVKFGSYHAQPFHTLSRTSFFFHRHWKTSWQVNLHSYRSSFSVVSHICKSKDLEDDAAPPVPVLESSGSSGSRLCRSFFSSARTGGGVFCLFLAVHWLSLPSVGPVSLPSGGPVVPFCQSSWLQLWPSLTQSCQDLFSVAL